MKDSHWPVILVVKLAEITVYNPILFAEQLEGIGFIERHPKAEDCYRITTKGHEAAGA